MSSNKIFLNAKWMVSCKIIQSLLQMIVGMLTARYLGPSNYGLISYAASVVAFAVPFMQLGMSDTLVREYVSSPEREGEILGTCLVMNLASGLACIVGVTCFAAVANKGESVTIIVCALYSLNLLFQAIEMTKYWFHAKLLSKYSSLAMLGAYITVSVYKIFLLATGKSVYWFALSYTVQYFVNGLFLVVVYKFVGGYKLQVSLATAKRMLSVSKFFVVANLMEAIFHNTSYVMLKLISGDAATGFYRTANTCMVIISFVYDAIIDSARPVILESKQISQELFERNICRLYSAVLYLTLAQSVCFALLAKPIVLTLYGRAYLEAVPVLQILVWQLIFSYMGVLRKVWILGEEHYSVLWRINLIGVIVNVLLNILMIPAWGACGAAAASVLTRVATNFVVGFCVKEIRPNNRLLLQGLNPKYLLEVLSKMKR